MIALKPKRARAFSLVLPVAEMSPPQTPKSARTGIQLATNCLFFFENYFISGPALVKQDEISFTQSVSYHGSGIGVRGCLVRALFQGFIVWSSLS